MSSIDLKVSGLFGAEKLAQGIQSRTGLVVESWMKTNSQLLVGLSSQSASSQMIQVFVTVAVAMGIASVLAVSVVQKSREIGIMRAVGTRSSQILRIFLIQGLLVGLIGSVGGIFTGYGLVKFFEVLTRNPDGTASLIFALNGALYLRTTVIATLVGVAAAVLPARRASRLDPAEVIRYG